MTVKYRSDIDGLRAIAVGSVVAYHLGFPFISGGFVGVDIFFVISGFLITAVITEAVRAHSFSYTDFYERRIRRILPAATVMIAVTLLVGIFTLMPSELVDLGWSTAAASLSVSNFYFWSQADYFDTMAQSRPLLHTWSLAVEEQFYLVYPVLLILVVRHAPRFLNHAIVAVLASTFLACVYTTAISPSSAFYLAPFRAWELALGAAVQADILRPARSRAIREPIAALGLAMLLASLFMIDRGDPFPGYRAAFPCIGTAMVIWAGRGGPSIAAALLSVRPLVFVGLISYSWYLWHWPIKVFNSLLNPLGLGPRFIDQAPAQLVVSFALGVLSWRFVERPFRNRIQWPRGDLFRLAGIATALVLIVAIGVVALGGLPQRYPPNVLRMASYLSYDEKGEFRTGKCFISSRDKVEQFDDALCLHKRAGAPSVLVLGDSHAAQLWYGLARELPAYDVMQATASGCKPTPDQAANADAQCTMLITRIYARLGTLKPDLILLGARWRDTDLTNLPGALRQLKASGARVVLLGPGLEYDTPLPRLLASSVLDGDPALPQRHRSAVVETTNRLLAPIAAQAGVEFVALSSLMCDARGCSTTAPDGAPLEFDSVGHLTREGSLLVAERLRDRLALQR